MPQELEKAGFRELVLESEIEVALVRGRWHQHIAAVLVVVEAGLNSDLHCARDAGQGNSAAAEQLGWEDVENIEIPDKVDHKVAYRTRLHRGAGHNHLEDLALRLLGRGEAEVSVHSHVGARHQHEGIQQVVGVAYYMVKRQS